MGMARLKTEYMKTLTDFDKNTLSYMYKKQNYYSTRERYSYILLVVYVLIWIIVSVGLSKILSINQL